MIKILYPATTDTDVSVGYIDGDKPAVFDGSFNEYYCAAIVPDGTAFRLSDGYVYRVIESRWDVIHSSLISDPPERFNGDTLEWDLI